MCWLRVSKAAALTGNPICQPSLKRCSKFHQRSPEVDVVRFLTVFPLSLSFRVVNSKLSGTGEMYSVPSMLLEVSSRELAAVMLDGLKKVSSVLEFIRRGRMALRLAEAS